MERVRLQHIAELSTLKNTVLPTKKHTVESKIQLYDEENYKNRLYLTNRIEPNTYLDSFFYQISRRFLLFSYLSVFIPTFITE